MANTKIPSELIADSSITAAKLADGTITTADIADSNVTTAKIADSNVTTAKIGDAQVTTAKITDANVTTGKIADDAVTTAKMASNSVTSDTIASGITLAGTTSTGALSVTGNITTAEDANAVYTLGRYSSGVAYSLLRASANATGLEIRTHAGNAMGRFLNNGTVQLFNNGTSVLTTDSAGINIPGTLDVGTVNVTGTVDGIDIAARDAVLTSTTTTAGAALPKAGGIITGNVSIRGNGNLEVGGYAGGTDYGLLLTPADSSNHYHLYTDTGGHLAFGAHGTIGSGEKMRLKSDGQLLLGINNSDVGFSTNAFELSGNIRMQGGNFGIKANDGSYEYYLIRSVSGNSVYIANDRIQVGAATGFVKITGGSATGLHVDGPIKTGGSGNYILFDYNGDMTGNDYYAIQDTSDDKLRISRAFSTTDCIEMDSSGNVAIQGGTLGVAGVVTGGSLVSSDGNLNSIAISAFKRNDTIGESAESSQWRTTSSYTYTVADGTRFYWIKVLTMPTSNCRGVLEYETKTDENYPGFTKGTIAFASFNGGASFSVQHDQSTAEGVAVTCRLDTSRALWVQFQASWASNSRWRISQYGAGSTVETSWTVGSNKLDPVSTSVPPNSSSNIDAGKNLRATSSSVTGALPSFQAYKKGDVQSDLQIIDDHVVYNGAVPLRFHYKGSDTYTKTVLYDGQNNTANNVLSGLTLEMGRLSNSSSATPRTFTISDRGATNKWCFSQYGLSFNPANSVASAAESLDDYEEGSYDAAITCASGSITLYGNYNRLSYVKIGSLVHVQGKLAVQTQSSPTGATTINLPFAIPNRTDSAGTATQYMSGYFNGSSLTTGVYGIHTEMAEGSSVARLFVHIGSATNNLGDGYVGTGTDLWINLTYQTD
jgi:hypothetical protein